MIIFLYPLGIVVISTLGNYEKYDCILTISVNGIFSINLGGEELFKNLLKLLAFLLILKISFV